MTPPRSSDRIGSGIVSRHSPSQGSLSQRWRSLAAGLLVASGALPGYAAATPSGSPVFSPVRGWQTTPVQLEFQSLTPQAIIRFTTDDRTGPSTVGAPERGDGPDQLTPHYLWTRLRENEAFRAVVSDRIRQHFFGQGALTPAACGARAVARINELEPALVAESAQWGDAQRADTLITPEDWWQAVEGVLADYFPWRTEVVLRQLAVQGWWNEPVARSLVLTRLTPILELRWLKSEPPSTNGSLGSPTLVG